MANPVLRWSPIILAASAKYKIPASVLAAQIQLESGGKEGLTSSAGAQGLTQFMPGTAQSYNVNVSPGHAHSQIFGAAHYLSDLGFSKDARKAIASYAAGPGNYQAGLGYADKLLATAKQYQSLDSRTPLASAPAGQAATTVTKTIPGVDRSQQRASLIANYLSNEHDPNALIELAVGLPQVQDTPAKKVTKTTQTSGPAAGPTASVMGEYPLAKHGKIIGTPHSGTHTLGNWQSDNAVDIGVPVGTKMLAWRNGVVVKVSPHPQDGSRFAGDGITIRYDNGQEVFYKHGVSRVHVGQRVQRGTVLGTTGSANGVPHLHIGLLKGNPLEKWG